MSAMLKNWVERNLTPVRVIVIVGFALIAFGIGVGKTWQTDVGWKQEITDKVSKSEDEIAGIKKDQEKYRDLQKEVLVLIEALNEIKPRLQNVGDRLSKFEGFLEFYKQKQ